MSLHIPAFENTTPVAFSWPHTVLDVMGQQALLQVWSLALAGEKSDIPEMLGARADAIRVAEQYFVLEQRQLKGWNMFKFECDSHGISSGIKG